MRKHKMELLTAVKETIVGDDTEVGEKTADGREGPTVTAEPVGRNRTPAPYQSEADFVIATGQTRKETLLELVEAHEGRMKQAELVDFTGWSKSTVSRLLTELECDGEVDRVQIGRCKVVLLPDESLVGEHTVSYETYR